MEDIYEYRIINETNEENINLDLVKCNRDNLDSLIISKLP